MIFRKDSRGDSFQRQISSLRNQSQDEELPNEEFQYEQSDDTSQFTTASTATRDQPYSPARSSAEDLSQAAMMGQTQPSFRPAWEPMDATTSMIAANAHWNGTLRSEGSLHIHGRADGEIHVSQDVFVAEGAQVDAQLFAENVVVAGLVRGRIEARGRLEILAEGHVSGDVKAPKLVVHEGAQLSGQLTMETGGSGTAAMAGEPGSTRGRRSTQQ